LRAFEVFEVVAAPSRRPTKEFQQMHAKLTRVATLMIGALLLAGCGGGSSTKSAAATLSAAPSLAAEKTTGQSSVTARRAAASSAAAARSAEAAASAAAASAAPLGRVDTFACQSFVAEAGEAYEWLTTLERDGTISGRLSTPGYIEAYQLGGTASVSAGQVTQPLLYAAMQDIVSEGAKLRTAIDDQGEVTPTPLRAALDEAADVCESGGFVINWN
jgi:hypothetical protein